MTSRLDISKIRDEPKFRKYYKLGLINELSIRNLQIKSEYMELRKIHTQTESIFQLSEKYNLCYDSVNTILFRKRQFKPVFFPPSNKSLTSL